MKINSRKVMAFIINTLIFTGCFILSGLFDMKLLYQISDSLIYAQLANTAFLLGSNWADKLTWSKHGIKNGKQSMIEQGGK